MVWMVQKVQMVQNAHNKKASSGARKITHARETQIRQVEELLQKPTNA